MSFENEITYRCLYLQKQPLREVLRKRYSENIQYTYRRTLMPRCDFIFNFIEIVLRHWCSPVNLLHFFKIPFPENTSGWLLLHLRSTLPENKNRT